MLPGQSYEQEPLFRPQSVHQSATFQFLHRVNLQHGLNLQTYLDLYKWSTIHLDNFWGLVWDETNVIGEKGSHVVDNTAMPTTNPPW